MTPARGTQAAALPGTIIVAIVVGLAASGEVGDPLIGAGASCMIALVIVALLQAAGVARGG